MTEKEKPLQKDFVRLNAGDKLREGDEYKCVDDWKLVPSFLFGDTIPQGTTEWRRPSDKIIIKKKWYHFFS